MDLAEALAELSLEADSPHDDASIRRAYLKGVKVRKPETDPEGFRRLREAYDLLRTFGPALAFATKQPRKESERENAGAADEEVAETAGGAAEATVDEEPTDGDWFGPDSLQPFRERFAAVPAKSWTERLEIAREAYRELPAHPGACYLVKDAITEGNARTDQVIAVLLPLAEQGDPASLWALLHLYPKYVPAAELARLRKQGAPPERLQAAGAYLAQDQPELAVVVLEETLQQDRDRGQNPFVVQQALRLVLSLHRRGDVALAGRAFAAVTACQGGALAPRVGEVGPQMALLQVLCRELDAVPDLPIAFRQDIARGVLEDDFGVMGYTVRAYERAHGRLKTLRLRKRLAERTPTLASLFHWNHEPRLSWRQVLPGGGFVGAVVVMAVIRCISSQLPSSHHQSGPAQVVTVSEPSAAEMPMRALCSWAVEQQLRTDLSPVEKRRLLDGTSSYCSSVSLLEAAMREGDCRKARALLAGLHVRTRGDSQWVRQEVQKLTSEVNSLCPP
jgi:hypothetical protein